MNVAMSSHLRPELPASGTQALVDLRKSGSTARRRRALIRVDKEMSRGNFKTALSLVKQLQRNSGGIRGFGAAKQVPKRLSSLDEMEVQVLQTSSLRSVYDSVMDSLDVSNLLGTLDEVPMDGVESLMHDEGYGFLCEDDLFMCMQHEAGHFLVSYLLGVLPKFYEVPSIKDFKQDKFVVGRIEFVGFEFLKEIAISRMQKKDSEVGNMANRSEISSKTFNNFSCIILGGLVAEHIVFGYSEGHYYDIDTLKSVLRWLGYSKSEAISQIRWAALNTVTILQRHTEARSRLAEAMSLGKSIGLCIDTIENAIDGTKI